MIKVVATAYWASILAIFYTFAGYPLLMRLIRISRDRPVRVAPFEPSVALVIPAYNEANFIEEKLRNSLSLSYPQDKLNIVVVADGSDDETLEIAARYSLVNVYHQAQRKGKVAAINRILPFINDEIIIFTDANTVLDLAAIRILVRNFADPSVAAVSGEKRVAGGGEGLYWRYESWMKRNESGTGSVMGAAGELFAVRRALYQPLPVDTLLDDFVASMNLVAEGWRVVYEPQAVATEAPLSNLSDDWQRRARNAAGGLQAINRLGLKLGRATALVNLQYFSHRVLRWAITPILLPLTLLLNLALFPRNRVYKFFLVGQILFYLTGLDGYFGAKRGRYRGLPFVIFYFCFANMAAIAGLWRFLSGNQPVTWIRTRL